MREQQEHRRQQWQTPPPSRKYPPFTFSNGFTKEPESLIESTENVKDLKYQLAEQAARVEVLQEDYDRLFLQNARLLNIIDEMRFKLYGRHPIQSERRTNSPRECAIDNKNSLDSAISLPTNVERESTFGYDEGSASFRSSARSINDEVKTFNQSYGVASRSFTEVEATCKRYKL